MNAQELFELAPLGARVTFTDGTPRPPDRFNKKLRAWKDNNDAGYFMGVKPGDGKHDWSKDGFVLRTLDDPVLIINRHFGTEGNKTFEVTPPAPGTIIATSKYNGEAEHIWRDMNAARTWAYHPREGASYAFDKQSWLYFIVAEDGTLKQATKVTATEIEL